ncbi:MAG: cupin domain-containing protein [Nitrosomonadales bacterium]|nr:cupin domain-containing protein [Nitrosomonadales bacterium]
MEVQGENYAVAQIGSFENLLQQEFRGIKGKRFIGEELGLTGCEVSINRLPPGKGMPFVHAHRKNEELYIVLRGNGIFYADGNEFPVCEGSLIRVDPKGGRALAAGDQDLYFICIQTEAGSLSQATLEDGFKVEARTSWM